MISHSPIGGRTVSRLTAAGTVLASFFCICLTADLCVVRAEDANAAQTPPEPDSPQVQRRIELLDQAAREWRDGRLDAAIEARRSALAIEEQIFGSDSERVLASCATLAEYYAEIANFEAARKFAARERAGCRARHGSDSWQTDLAETRSRLIEKLEIVDPYERRQYFEARRQVRNSWLARDYESALRSSKIEAQKLAGWLGRDNTLWTRASVGIYDALIWLGDMPGLREQLEAQVAERETVRGPHHPDAAAFRTALADLVERLDENDLAIALYRRCIEDLEAAGCTHELIYRVALNNLAVVYDKLTRYEEAIDYYQRSVDAARWDASPDEFELRKQRENLANAMDYAATDALWELRIEEAARLWDAAAPLWKDLQGANSYRMLDSRRNRDLARRIAAMGPEDLSRLKLANRLADDASTAFDKGDYQRARELSAQRVGLLKEIYGERHLDVALAMNDVAVYATWQDDIEDAVEIYRDVEAIYAEVLPENHPWMADLQLELSFRSDEPLAKRLQRGARALRIYEATTGRETGEYADALTCYGDTLTELGRRSEARDVYREAVRVWRMNYGRDVARYCNALYGLAQAEYALDRQLHAEPWFREAIRLRKQLFGESDDTYGLYANELANVLYYRNAFEEAEQFYRIALAVNEANGTDQSEDAAIRLSNLARVRIAVGDLAGAREFLAKSLQVGRALPSASWVRLDALFELAGLEEDAEDYQAAEKLLSEAGETTKELHGPQSPEYAELLRRRGDLLHAQGRADEARALWDAAWELLEEMESESADATAAELRSLFDQLNSLATTLKERLSLDHAVKVYELNYRVARRLYGADDWRLTDARLDAQEGRQIVELPAATRKRFELAHGQVDVMLNHAKQGNYSEFRWLAEEIIAAYRAALGDDHRQTGDAYLWMAEAGQNSIRYHDGYQWHAACLENRRRTLGEHHPLYAKALQNTAAAASDVQQFDEAVALLEEALSVQGELFGDQSEAFADTLLTLSEVRRRAGDPLAALEPGKKALDLYRRIYGARSLEHSQGLKAVAWIYSDLGEEDRAVALMLESFDIDGALLSQDDARFWKAKLEASRFAAAFSDAREVAEGMLRECAERIAEMEGRFHPDYAVALNALGDVYRQTDRSEEALRTYREVVAIRERSLGPEHPLTGEALAQVGMVTGDMGRIDEATELLAKSLAVRENTYGPESPELALSMLQLAKMHARGGRSAEAAEYAETCLQVNRRELQRISAWTSELSLSAIADEGDDAYDLLLSLTARDLENKDFARAAVDWTLRRKGAVLDALCNARSSQRVLAYEPGVAVRIDRLRELQQREVDLAMAQNASGDVPAKLRDVQEEMAGLRESIAADLQDRGVQLDSFLEVDADVVRAALAPDEALVEFVCWRPFDFATGQWQPNHYLALVATGRREEWRVADLGPISRPNAMIDRLRTANRQAQRELRFADEAELSREFDKTSGRLYEALFAPLADDLADAKRLYVAADGFLHTAPLAVMATGPDQYFIERHDLAYLSSGRDLLHKRPAPGRGTLIFANPDFDIDASERKLTLASLSTPAAPPALLAMRAAPANASRGLRWRELPGAALEAEQVSGLLAGSDFDPVVAYTGAEALEDVFKAASPPRILHVATHGFFLEPLATDAQAGDASPAVNSATRLSQLRSQENALLRSGIVFAGANNFDDPGDASAADDGWLTAMEIAALDLEGVELAVLSACNTGMGDVEAGEGVVGLQRAFLHAGAQSLVTSLFEVPDEETQSLMTEFYRRLRDSDSILASFSEAQRAIIAQRREAYGAAHPFYWGSFVLLGAPR